MKYRGLNRKARIDWVLIRVFRFNPWYRSPLRTGLASYGQDLLRRRPKITSDIAIGVSLVTGDYQSPITNHQSLWNTKLFKDDALD
jgi:hypothetical protein